MCSPCLIAQTVRLTRLPMGYQTPYPSALPGMKSVMARYGMLPASTSNPITKLPKMSKLVLLASGLPISYSPVSSIPESQIYSEGGSAPHVPARVLLIGWTDIIYDILQELDAHSLCGTEVTVLSCSSNEQAEKEIADHQDKCLQKPDADLSERRCRDAGSL